MSLLRLFLWCLTFIHIYSNYIVQSSFVGSSTVRCTIIFSYMLIKIFFVLCSCSITKQFVANSLWSHNLNSWNYLKGENYFHVYLMCFHFCLLLQTLLLASVTRHCHLCKTPNTCSQFLNIQSSCRENRHPNNRGTYLSHGLYAFLYPLSYQPVVLWNLFLSLFQSDQFFFSKGLYACTPLCPITSYLTSPPLWLSSARQSSKLRQLSALILHSRLTWIITINRAASSETYKFMWKDSSHPGACLHALSLFWILSPFYLYTAKNDPLVTQVVPWCPGPFEPLKVLEASISHTKIKNHTQISEAFFPKFL